MNDLQERLQQFMTAEQVAESAGVTRARVYQLCRAGNIQAIKLAGAWFIARDSALEWIYSDRKPGRPRKDKGDGN